MKHLVLTLWFVLFLSSSALAGVEHVTEEVCHAIAGCWVDTKTGECPDCVLETREVVHTHEEKPVVVENHIRAVATITKKKPLVEPLVVKTIPKKTEFFCSYCRVTTPSNKKWVGTLFKCEVGCRYAYWDSAGNNYDENIDRVYN